MQFLSGNETPHSPNKTLDKEITPLILLSNSLLGAIKSFIILKSNWTSIIGKILFLDSKKGTKSYQGLSKTT